ncbi:hypothetical protein [Chlamydia sp.]|uniref:hypothetical protein n=1 Tax=Chlamydia sp. TaxID=35827 RepID=UPI0025BBB881|nr:hypothetical protein [Chlamydia sp.]MBQ8498502.1 hypothetical protein [Chlamydia sp.]
MGFGTVRGKGKALKSFFLKPLQNLEVRLFFIPIVLFLGGIGCLSLVPSLPLLVVLGIMSIFVALVSFLHGWGYGISVIGAISLGLVLCSNFSVPTFWGGLLTLTFIVSYGILLLGISLVEGLIEEKTASLTKLATLRDELQESYNRQVQERKEGERFFEGRILALEEELSVCRKHLEEISRKYEHTDRDLQILISQRDDWLKDYSILHQEYVRVATGGEEGAFFPWTVFEGNLEKEACDPQFLLEVENKIAHLEKTCEEETCGKRYAEECLEKALADLLEAIRHREVLERENIRKDSEIESLKQEIVTEKLLSHSANHERAVYKGKYLQLREQFKAKDACLRKARQERFLAQEQLLTLKREEEASNPSAIDNLFIIQDLLSQIEALEEEIICLEGLVLHNQNP